MVLLEKLLAPSTYDLDHLKDKTNTIATIHLNVSSEISDMSRVMRKPTVCLYKSENETLEQRLCLRYRDDTSRSNSEDRFSRDAAHIQL